jgi:hypothetical protein
VFTSYHNNGAVGRVQKEESGEEGEERFFNLWFE